MEQAVPAKSSIEKLGLTLLWFLLHLAFVYVLANFVVLWPAAQFHNLILPLIGMPSSESPFAFAFNYLFPFSVLCGLLAGVFVATCKHRAAQFVWIVPTVVLAFKFVAFPSSLLANHFAVAFHHFFAGGFVVPEYHDYGEMFANYSPDYDRGIDQLRFAAPAYVSVAYGFGSWAGARLGIRLPVSGAPRTSRGGAPQE